MDTTGKRFEQQFKYDWSQTFKNSFLLRLPDQQSGYFGTSRNLCDFIAFTDGTLFLIECKTIKGNTFPLKNLTQYDKLLAKKDIKGVRAGAIIWFRDHNKVIFVPIKTFEQCYNEGLKSINVKMIGDKNYFIIDIPSKKKRTFLTSDYSVLLNINEDLFNGKQ